MFGGSAGYNGFSATANTDEGVPFDPDEPDCTRYLYTWAGVDNSTTMDEETEWDEGKGWPSSGRWAGYVLTPIFYDSLSVATLISHIHAAISGDYTIYEIHGFGRLQILEGDPETEPPWWTVLYANYPAFLIYQADTQTWEGRTLLELLNRQMIS